MNKIFVIVILGAAFALCATLVAGCVNIQVTSTSGSASSSTSVSTGLTAKDATMISTFRYNDIMFSQGNQMVAELDSNPSTGYTWTVEIKGDAVELMGESFTSSETDTTTTGAGGTQRYEFKGTKAGETTITFTYGRPGEANDSDLHYTAAISTNSAGEVITLITEAVTVE